RHATEGSSGMSKRVALVLGSSTGGIGQHVASLARGLARRGFFEQSGSAASGAAPRPGPFEVTVIGPAATGERFDFTGAAYHVVPVPTGPRAVPALSRALADLR